MMRSQVNALIVGAPFGENEHEITIINAMDLSESDIITKLDRAYNPSLLPESPYPADLIKQQAQPAAVLIPFLRDRDEWQLLFIRRTNQTNDRHSGQVAFPGGRCDPTDPDAESAALREAFEETGIASRDVRILGRLRSMLTITGYVVTPIVGVISWPYKLTPQPEEVSRIFRIPLFWLADPVHHEVRSRKFRVKGESIPVINFHPYDGEVLWGASARITMLLLEALGLSLPELRYI
jgi:8-oxo-dGTP pyrophosphatase MutT (NUDIX family)